MQAHSASVLPTFADILRDNPGWLDEAIDTDEASRITCTPGPTLETLRTRGGGPVFFKPTPGKVRYTRRTCFEWNVARRCRSTSDSGEVA